MYASTKNSVNATLAVPINIVTINNKTSLFLNEAHFLFEFRWRAMPSRQRVAEVFAVINARDLNDAGAVVSRVYLYSIKVGNRNLCLIKLIDYVSLRSL